MPGMEPRIEEAPIHVDTAMSQAPEEAVSVQACADAVDVDALLRHQPLQSFSFFRRAHMPLRCAWPRGS